MELEANPIDFRRLEYLFEPTAFHCLATCAPSFLRLLWWWLSNTDMLIKEMIKSICHSHMAASRISSTTLPFIWQYKISVGDRHSTCPRTVKTADMNSNFYLSTHGSGCTQLKILEETETMTLLAHNHSFHPTVTLIAWVSNFTTLISLEMQQAPLMAKQDPLFLLVWKKERKGEIKAGGGGKKGRKKEQEGLARDLLCILQEK